MEIVCETSWNSVGSAPTHPSLLVGDFLAKNCIVITLQPLSSSNLAPYDLFPFPKLKRSMKARGFATIKEIKAASVEEVFRRLAEALAQVFYTFRRGLL